MLPHIKATRFNDSFLPIFSIIMVLTVTGITSARAEGPEPMYSNNKAKNSDTMRMGKSKMDGMSMTSDKDYDFAVNMRMHHQMAIEMAQSEMENGKNPEMILMAKDIIAAHKEEIAKFDKWLQTHKNPVVKRGK